MLTAERLREVLSYDQDTGLWKWRVRLSKSIKVGQPSGVINAKGYVVIKVDKTLYYAHRLAWLYMMGEWPKEDIRSCE